MATIGFTYHKDGNDEKACEHFRQVGCTNCYKCLVMSGRPSGLEKYPIESI